MNPLNGLAEYLQRIERRLRLLAVSRGVALAAGAALAFTVLGALIANHFAFSSGSVLGVRLVLFLALAAAVGAGLVLPLLRLNRRKAAHEAENRCPQFGQRLVTFAERAGQPDAFLELLAADTLDVAREAQPEQIAPRKNILSFASAGALAVALLLWLAVSGPGFLGYGTSLLWGAIPRNGFQPFYDVQVQPGNHTVRRKSDQLVTARLRGFQADRVRVLAKFQSSSKWEEASMSPQPGAGGFEFLFAGVPEAFDYYVDAAGVRSQQYHISVVDLPEVKKLRVTYHYPAWTDLKDSIEDPGGDLRAVEGTEAEVRVVTDRPLANGALLLEDGTKFDLHDGVARVPMQKDGAYHVATAEAGDMVRLSDDYFIEVQKATPPKVRIVRPGRDAKVNPIEEVTITVQAEDDFALRGMQLHYSVNGGPEKTVALGGTSGKKAEGSTTLYLEDYKLIPGDIVSLYASARDALAASRSDMFFIQAEPFEREYSQSQQMGGAGGGDMDLQASERQKELTAATWNQIKNPPKDKATEEENARLLSGIQSKLRDQAKSLAERMKSREMAGANPAFKSFAEDMGKAVEAMGQATTKLSGRDWQGALPPEQKSLQYLSRAEATFRDIQVAFGNSGGGRGGAGRDLEGMFDLELDREKNQFETGRNAASPDQQQKAMEEALAKLEELARRQQELAERQRQNQQAYQQRWQQEMLRREAEELRRKMEQMARSQGQASQGQEGQQSQQSGGGQSAAMNRALQRLTEAMREMQNAGSPQNQGTPQSEAEARRAAERLREAREMLAGERKQEASQQMSELARKTRQIAEEQQNFEKNMRQAFGFGGQEDPGRPSLQQPGISRQQVGQVSAQQQELLKKLTDLEEQMQKAARDMAGSQPSASRNLRDALGEMQQRELRLKMKWSLEVLRRGMAEYALTRQPEVTQGLSRLRDRVQEAQSALNRQPSGGQDIESALAQAERLRGQLEQMKSAAQGSREQQAQNGQQGKNPGQSAGQSRGQQPGQGSQSPDGESNTGAAQGGNSPDAIYGSGPVGATGRGYGIDPMQAERTFREGARDLAQLEQFLRGNREMPRELSRDVHDLIRDLQQVDARLLGAEPARLAKIIDQLVGGVEGVELQLRRLADQQQAGSVRSGASQPVPQGYADAVAEYFKRLAREK
jgi:hypothetical protein